MEKQIDNVFSSVIDASTDLDKARAILLSLGHNSMLDTRLDDLNTQLLVYNHDSNICLYQSVLDYMERLEDNLKEAMETLEAMTMKGKTL